MRKGLDLGGMRNYVSFPSVRLCDHSMCCQFQRFDDPTDREQTRPIGSGECGLGPCGLLKLPCHWICNPLHFLLVLRLDAHTTSLGRHWPRTDLGCSSLNKAHEIICVQRCRCVPHRRFVLLPPGRGSPSRSRGGEVVCPRTLHYECPQLTPRSNLQTMYTPIHTSGIRMSTRR